MTRCFGIVLFVITLLSLSEFTLAELTQSTEQTPNQGAEQKANLAEDKPQQCSKVSVEYKNAGKDFYDTVRSMLSARLQNETVNVTADSIELTQKAAEFLKVGNESCLHWPSQLTFSHATYISLLQFSLKNATLLRDLQKKEQFKCVDEQKAKLLKCGSQNITERSECGSLIRSSLLNFNSVACVLTDRNKDCVTDVLKTTCPHIVEYTKSLFDFMKNIDQCKSHFQANMDSAGAQFSCPGYWATITVASLGLSNIWTR